MYPLPISDQTPATTQKVNKLMQPPVEGEVDEDNDETLKWKWLGQKGSKGKEKIEKFAMVVKSHTTRSVE